MTSHAGRNPIAAVAAAFLLVAITAAAYWVVLDHAFLHFDDNEYVTENTIVMQGLTWDGARWAFTTLHFSNWHPLTWLSHMADVQLFGAAPRGHHAVNLVLHVANALLVFWLLARVTKSRWPSFLVAAWFAVHPLHVESVAWISERKDLLSTFFGLLTLLAYSGYAQKKTCPRYLGTSLLFALALMSKPMMVTLPCVMLLLDLWPLKRLHIGQERVEWKKLGPLALEKLPLFALSAGSAAITVVAQSRGGAVGSIERFSIGVRAENAVLAYGQYLLKTLWPANLAVLYPHPGDKLHVIAVATTATILVAITTFALWQIRRRPFLAVGWFWFLGMLVPVIGLVQIGAQAYADRYMYLPMVGLFIMIVWGARSLVTPRLHPMAFGFAVAIALVWAPLSHVQARYWRDSETLFRHALDVTRNNYVAHTSLGMALLRKGEIDQAYEHFEKARAINPNYPEALNNIGYIYLTQGRSKEALELLEQAVRMYPRHIEAHVNLGIALAGVQRYDESIHHLEYAVEQRPQMTNAWFNLGMAQFARKNFRAAALAFRQVVDQSPNDAEARRLLGVSWMQLGDHEAATAEFKRLLEMNPQQPEIEGYLQQIEGAGGTR